MYVHLLLWSGAGMRHVSQFCSSLMSLARYVHLFPAQCTESFLIPGLLSQLTEQNRTLMPHGTPPLSDK